MSANILHLSRWLLSLTRVELRGMLIVHWFDKICKKAEVWFVGSTMSRVRKA